MAAEQKYSTDFLDNYKEELETAFRIYNEDIIPFIVQFEVSKNQFPVEVQNEIRAIYGHLVRASLATDDTVAKQNVDKIYSHTKRALLDCYKYNCVVMTDKYAEFFDRYQGVDLSYLREGRFLAEVHKAYQDAKNKLLEAKKAESQNTKMEQLFSMYQDAYCAFADLIADLDSCEEKAEFLKHKATKKERMANVSFAIGVAGLIVGIAGLFVAFL